MRIGFAGTPASAAEVFAQLISRGVRPEVVLTRPDAPSGRGQVVVPSPVAQWAGEQGFALLKEWPTDQLVDCWIVVAFGALIPARLLDRATWLNLHYSLLPRWRGAAPVQRALLAGDTQTGVTVFKIDSGLDTGPILAQQAIDIEPDETSAQLLARLGRVGADLLAQLVARPTEWQFTPQPLVGVTSAAKIGKAELRVDWHDSAEAVCNRVRALSPWTQANGARLVILQATAAPEVLEPGEVSVIDRRVLVGTATTAVQLGQVQPAGRRAMSAIDWLNGLRGQVWLD